MRLIFNVGWADEMTGQDMFFYAPEGKTKQDCVDDIKSLIVKYADEFLKSCQENMESPGMDNWTIYAANKLPELGYERFKPITWLAYSSSFSPIMHSSKESFWKHTYESDDIRNYNNKEKEFLELIGKELFEKAWEVGEEVEQKWKDFDKEKDDK